MKKLVNQNSQFLYQLKLALQSAGIVSVVMGFVFIAYLDLPGMK